MERALGKAYENSLVHKQIDLMRAVEMICDCYCKFPDEYRSMYKDVDVANENLMREKCEMCPLMKLEILRVPLG